MPGSKLFLHTYSYACGSLFLGCPYSVKTKKESFPKEAITILCLEGAKKWTYLLLSQIEHLLLLLWKEIQL